MKHEAVSLLIKSLRTSLENGDVRSALRRLSLFEMMYGYDEEGELVTSSGKKIILLSDAGERIIADEYMADGRLHLLKEPKYAIFDRENMTLEFQKVVIEIKEIFFEADKWPSGVTDMSYTGLFAYFFGETT